MERLCYLLSVTIVVAGADPKIVSEVIAPLLLEETYTAVMVTTEGLKNEHPRVRLERCATIADVADRAVEIAFSLSNSILLKGQIQTATLLKAILKRQAGKDRRIISQVTKIELNHSKRQFLLTDPALNIEPSVAEKVDICLNALEVAYKLGLGNPKLALLSSVEVLNLKIPSAVAADKVATYFKRHKIAGIVEGPLSMDVATDPEAASSKGYSGMIQGDADILVAPGIDAANILYKTLVHFTDCRVSGVLVGTSVPIALTSRSDSAEAKIEAIKLAGKLIE